MKPFITLITLLSTVLISTYFFSIRANNTYNELDLLQTSLAPIRKFVSPKDLIFLKLYPYNPTIFTQTEYAIVPNVMSIKDSTTSKWRLAIFKLKETDPAQMVDTLGQTVAWQAYDSVYLYRLTRNLTAR